MKRKPCGRKTRFGVCNYERAPGKQRCRWHVLMASSSDAQADAAQDRREGVVEYIARVPREKCPPGERWCAGCQSFVPLFYCSGSRCKACNSSAAHERRLETTYGITPEEYRRIFHDVQGGRCAVCRNQPRSIRFAVDHDHKTGEVRGILCKRCNHDLLGGGHDSIDTLWNAIEYLLFPPARYPVRPTKTAVHDAVGDYLVAREALARSTVPEALPAPF